MENVGPHQWLKWPGQAGGSRGVEGVGNLIHFEHKITLFNKDNTIFLLTLRGSSSRSCYRRVGSNGAGG